MSHDDDTTPRSNGSLSLQDRLEQIEGKLDDVLSRFESLPIRVRALEIVLYGAAALVLLAFANSIIGDHVRPAQTTVQTIQVPPAPTPATTPVLVK